MEVMEAIKSRRSVRKFSGRLLEEEKLLRVLEAGRLSPSSRNDQEWRFILVRDPKKLKLLMEAADGQIHVGEAPAAIVVCGTDRHLMDCGQPTDTVNCSIALAYMMLEAHELGLGTCWLGHFFADKVKKALDIPDYVSVVAFTPIGYPAEEPAGRPRKRFGEVVSYDAF
jgi:nitroreductase